MNYIKELNAFYDWLETNSLSTSAIALWHALMHINNKAGWVAEFGVAVSVLCIKTGLAERTIGNARNELKQKGRIDWKTRKGNQSAVYKMISLFDNVSATGADKLSDKVETDTDENELSAINADNVSVSVSDNTSDSVSGNASTLNKLNKTKLDLNTSTSTESQVLNFDEEFSELAKLYQKCGFEYDGITPDWIEDSKEKYGFEWVKNAMTEAANQGARNRAYVNKILNNWKSWGGMKLSTDKNNSQPKVVTAKKTRFHTAESRTENYTNDQLEDVVARKRREAKERMKAGD